MLSSASLYIPHSSDKTRKLGTVFAFFFFFTSHIVQIKLYVQQALREILEELYIPHSSDKTITTPYKTSDKQDFTSHIVQIKRE